MDLITNSVFRISVLIMIAGISFIIIIYRVFFQKSVITQRIQDYILSRTQKIRLRRDQEFTESLYERTIGAFLRRLGHLLSRFQTEELIN